MQSEKRIFRVRQKIVFFENCLYLDPDLNLAIALKLRPYGGSNGIEISSLNVYFKIFCTPCFTRLVHLFMSTVNRDTVANMSYTVKLQKKIRVMRPVLFFLYLKNLKDRLFSRLES